MLAAGDGEGAARLTKDLQERADRNKKRVHSGEAMDGVNKQNAIFNKSLRRTMEVDIRSQTIKHNLERGTAL
jgi:hypothetical protein